MFSDASFHTILRFVIALALTHLLVLPIKSFFMEPNLQKLAQRMTLANVAMTTYAILAFFILGGHEPGTLWSTIKLVPVLVVGGLSIGVWIYLMFKGPGKLLVVDAAIFTALSILVL